MNIPESEQGKSKWPTLALLGLGLLLVAIFATGCVCLGGC